MPYQIGMTTHNPFTTANAAGVAADADALPVGVLSRNGAVTAVPVTITLKASPGSYDAAADLTTVNGFAPGDCVSIRALCTIGGTANIPVEVCSFVVDNGTFLIGGIGANAVTITARDAGTLAAISGAVVVILDATAVGTVGALITNGAGQAIFHLAAGTYTARVHAVGYTGLDAAVVVAGAMAQNVDLTAFAAHPNPVAVVASSAVGEYHDETVELVQGKTAIPLQIRFRERDGLTIIDTTLATGATFIMRLEETGLPIGGAMTRVDDLLGRWQYAWGATDLDVAGTYYGEAELTWPPGQGEATPAKQPIRLEVRPKIG